MAVAGTEAQAELVGTAAPAQQVLTEPIRVLVDLEETEGLRGMEPTEAVEAMVGAREWLRAEPFTTPET